MPSTLPQRTASSYTISDTCTARQTEQESAAEAGCMSCRARNIKGYV
jgi:hypothetical protein